MKIALRILFFLLISLPAEAQVTYFKSYDGFTGYSAVESKDGGIVMAGTDIALGNTYKTCLMKMDEQGNVLWMKCYGGDSLEYLRTLATTYDGGYIMGGVTQSFGAGTEDMYFIRTDSLGDTLWTRTFGGISWDGVTELALATDSGFVFAGYAHSFGVPTYSAAIVKVSNNGNIEWSKIYGIPGGHNLFRSICPTSDGGFIVAGRYVQNTPVILDFYLMKIDASGNIQWDKHYGSGVLTGNYPTSELYSVKQTSDNGFIACGERGYPAISGNRYLFDIIKTDSIGNLVWDKTYGDSSGVTLYDYGYSIEETNDGNYMAAGVVYAAGALKMSLLKTDTAGNLLWSHAYGGSNSAGESRALELSDSSIILYGSLGMFSGYSFSVLKTNWLGSLSCYDDPANIPVYTYPQSGSNASTIVDSLTISLNSPNTQRYIRQVFDITVCFANSTEENAEMPAIDFYPTPFSEFITIDFGSNNLKDAVLTIRNLQGQILFKETNDGDFTQIKTLSLQSLVNGIYLLEIKLKGQHFTRKIVKDN